MRRLSKYIRKLPSRRYYIMAACGLLSVLSAQGNDNPPISEQSPLVFRFDTADQVDGRRIFRQVDTVWHTVSHWKNEPDDWEQSAAWLMEREEGVIRWMSADYGMGDPFKNYTVDAEGNYRFKPSPDTKKMFDFWLDSESVKPVVNIGTAGIPAPLIEGGYKEDLYLYNVRQPNDYEKWHDYIATIFQWLVDNYGRDEVKTWGFLFGYESDWQTRSVIPGTEKVMNKGDNRREFIKMLDYFHAAAESVVGPGVYVGCYFAIKGQAPDYLKHWAEGTNYATGETGTRIAWFGFSDWYRMSKEKVYRDNGKLHYDPATHSLSPFNREPTGTTGGEDPAVPGAMLNKYEFLTNLRDSYPQLERLDLHLSEAGYLMLHPEMHPAQIAFADHHGAAQ